jgi:histone H1/5
MTKSATISASNAHRSRKLKKADRALAKVEKAAAKVGKDAAKVLAKAAKAVAKANRKRDRILDKEQLRRDARAARHAASNAVQHAAKSASKSAAGAVDATIDVALGITPSHRTLSSTSRPAKPSPGASSTVAELRETAKAKSIVGYSKMTKAELLKALS